MFTHFWSCRTHNSSLAGMMVPTSRDFFHLYGTQQKWSGLQSYHMEPRMDYEADSDFCTDEHGQIFDDGGGVEKSGNIVHVAVNQMNMTIMAGEFWGTLRWNNKRTSKRTIGISAFYAVYNDVHTEFTYKWTSSGEGIARVLTVSIGSDKSIYIGGMHQGSNKFGYKTLVCEEVECLFWAKFAPNDTYTPEWILQGSTRAFISSSVLCTDGSGHFMVTGYRDSQEELCFTSDSGYTVKKCLPAGSGMFLFRVCDMAMVDWLHGATQLNIYGSSDEINLPRDPYRVGASALGNTTLDRIVRHKVNLVMDGDKNIYISSVVKGQIMVEGSFFKKTTRGGGIVVPKKIVVGALFSYTNIIIKYNVKGVLLWAIKTGGETDFPYYPVMILAKPVPEKDNSTLNEPWDSDLHIIVAGMTIGKFTVFDATGTTYNLADTTNHRRAFVAGITEEGRLIGHQLLGAGVEVMCGGIVHELKGYGFDLPDSSTSLGLVLSGYSTKPFITEGSFMYDVADVTYEDSPEIIQQEHITWAVYLKVFMVSEDIPGFFSSDRSEMEEEAIREKVMPRWRILTWIVLLLQFSIGAYYFSAPFYKRINENTGRRNKYDSVLPIN